LQNHSADESNILPSRIASAAISVRQEAEAAHLTLEFKASRRSTPLLPHAPV